MPLLTDGYKTIISLANDSLLFEIEVTPPAIDGGEVVAQDHMRSGFLSIFFPRKRRRLSPFTLMVAWDTSLYYQAAQNVHPNVVAGMLATVNKNQLITITFPDSATLAFWGTVNKFEPGALKEGERPTATLTVTPTLLNCSNVIVTPVWTIGTSNYCA